MRPAVLIAVLFSQLYVSCAQNCSSERYLQDIFPSSVSQDVVYGNSPALTAIYVAENVTVDQDMTMDVFFPVGDGLPKRPAVILAYGGGYLFGTKEDEDVWTTCDSLAKKGYVTASINYRMNLNAASQSSSVRAIYRASQDYSAALRFLKENAETYGIDTNYIFAGGVSAGGFSAMHMAFMDESERPPATFQSGLGGMNPDLGCLSCSGNDHQHSNQVRGIINLWGAMLDTAFIQQDEVVPTVLFHGTADLIVPYQSGLPFTALLTMPSIHGSASIAQRMSNLGGSPELNLFDGVGHNIWGVNVNNVLVGGPTEHWNPITDSIISFLYEHIRPELPVLVLPESFCESDTVLLEVSNVPIGGRACWEVEGATVISASQDSSQLTLIWGQPGSYQLHVTVFNHLQAASIPFTTEITVYGLPSVSITQNGNELLAGGSHPYYQWYLDGVPLQGENLSILVPMVPGTYTVEAVNSFGCTSVSDPLTVVGLPPRSQPVTGAHSVTVFDVCGRGLASLSIGEWSQPASSHYRGVLLLAFYNAQGELLRWEKTVR